MWLILCRALRTQRSRVPVIETFTKFREERQADMKIALGCKRGDKGSYGDTGLGTVRNTLNLQGGDNIVACTYSLLTLSQAQCQETRMHHLITSSIRYKLGTIISSMLYMENKLHVVSVVKQSMFKSQVCCFLDVWLWASYATSLCLSSTCEKGASYSPCLTGLLWALHNI